MQNAFMGSLSLVDASGHVIIAAILTLLATSVGCTWLIRKRYGKLANELKHRTAQEPFASRVLELIVRDTREAAARSPWDVNVQGIVEHRFQSELHPLLVGERFVKASTGLSIILGLVGTFYGLTSAIGKLVVLVSADSSPVTDVTESITRGLTQALSGMSVAFSTSLFGIFAAITMTLVGVFLNVSDRRTSLMVQIETFLDHHILNEARAASGDDRREGAGRSTGAVSTAKLASMMDDFGQAVGKLDRSIAGFDSALEKFASDTRNFQEFNLHLKDNIQRMSLGFADLSDTLKAHAQTLKSRGQG